MPAGRPTSNVDAFRAEITHSYELGLTNEEILQSFQAHGCKIQIRTLQRKIRGWGLERCVGYKDTSIQMHLQKCGLSTSRRTIQAIRLGHGMKWRYVNDDERDAAIAAAARWLEVHAQISSDVRSFERAYLYEFIRTQASIIVGKNPIYQYYKTWGPEHMKLQKMGFEVSRVHALFTRANMGVETDIFAGAQALLAEADGTRIPYEARNEQEGNQNQRIESWWGLLRTGSTDCWVCFGDELSTIGYLNSQDERDLIAVYAIHGHRLRTNIAEFIQPRLVYGKSTEIYESSEVNCGIPIEENTPADEILQTMYAPLENIEIEVFVMDETDQWCRTLLEAMEFDDQLLTDEDHKRPYLPPQLALTPHPTGGYDEYMNILRNNILNKGNQHLHGEPIPDNMLAGMNDDYDLEE
ncbi:hypothetical protein GGS21DRAFT_537899 [Xylaria nigripes]|nr:hypothetical protein GGS21DRAFT_537899 [Xylaria nigripes]